MLCRHLAVKHRLQDFVLDGLYAATLAQYLGVNLYPVVLEYLCGQLYGKDGGEAHHAEVGGQTYGVAVHHAGYHLLELLFQYVERHVGVRRLFRTVADDRLR